MRASFEPATRWSTSTPSRRPGAGPELLDDRGEIVDAAEVFDDDALDPQVVTPDLFDEFGVVTALDVDPAARATSRVARAATEPDAVRVARGAARRGGVKITGRPSMR